MRRSVDRHLLLGDGELLGLARHLGLALHLHEEVGRAVPDLLDLRRRVRRRLRERANEMNKT
jgi:hypothetical protein